VPVGVYVRTKRTKQILSEARKRGKKSPFKGRKHTKETKCKMSKAKWKGGKFKTNGYVYIWQPNHPNSVKKYIMEHRLVMEQYLGRYLTKKEVVHHINGIRNDNRIENLMLLAGRGYHSWIHRKGFCNSKGILFNPAQAILKSMMK